MEEISPLFAVDAEHLLRNGLYEDAIQLCEEGLKEFPDYPAAIAILAKAYKGLGDTGMAHNILDNAAKAFPAFKTIKNAQDNIDNPIDNMNVASTIDSAEIDELIENADEFENNFDNSDTLINEEMESDSELAIENYSFENILDDSELIEDDLISDEKVIEDYNLDEVADNVELEAYYIENDVNTQAEIVENFGNEEFEEESEINNQSNNIEQNLNRQYSKSSRFNFDLEIKSKLLPSIKFNASIPDLIPGLVELIPDYYIYQKRKKQKISLFDIERSLKSYRSNPLEVFHELDLMVGNKEHSTPEKTMYDDDYEEYAKPTVITETIANILFQQGAIDEAIEAYQQLAENNFEKRDYFLNKIEEIKSNNF